MALCAPSLSSANCIGMGQVGLQSTYMGMTFGAMGSGDGGAEEQQDPTWPSTGRSPLPRDPKSGKGVPPGLSLDRT